MRYILLIISFAILFASCSIIRKDTNKQEDKQEQIATDKKADKPLTDKQKQRQREKEIQANRKKQLEENKKRDKEFAKKKKQEEKEKRRKEKEQDDIIKNATKTERQRIKEERKKEKESLLSSQKLAEQEANALIKKQQELEAQEQQRLTDQQKQEELLANQEKEASKQAMKEQQELLKQEREKAEQEKKAKQEERKKKFESLSTMDQIIYRMQHPEEEIEQEEYTTSQEQTSDSVVTSLTDNEKKKIIALKDKEKDNFFKRTYRKVFPKKEVRSKAYSKMYNEKPLTIMVAYPWNRSEYKEASEMAYTGCVRELCEKGYYVLPALSFMDELKKDTTKNTKYLTLEQIKSFKEKYNADAVLLMTIYRAEKPWWSTNINVVTHYDLISTQSLDTLFVRHADFNYDSPMPVKEKNNKKLLNDPERMLYLGLFERMQKYVFLDLPAGPYHKDYQQDKKRKAESQEVKYKVTIKPS